MRSAPSRQVLAATEQTATPRLGRSYRPRGSPLPPATAPLGTAGQRWLRGEPGRARRAAAGSYAPSRTRWPVRRGRVPSPSPPRGLGAGGVGGGRHEAIAGRGSRGARSRYRRQRLRGTLPRGCPVMLLTGERCESRSASVLPPPRRITGELVEMCKTGNGAGEGHRGGGGPRRADGHGLGRRGRLRAGEAGSRPGTPPCPSPPRAAAPPSRPVRFPRCH